MFTFSPANFKSRVLLKLSKIWWGGGALVAGSLKKYFYCGFPSVIKFLARETGWPFATESFRCKHIIC